MNFHSSFMFDLEKNQIQTDNVFVGSRVFYERNLGVICEMLFNRILG